MSNHRRQGATPVATGMTARDQWVVPAAMAGERLDRAVAMIGGITRGDATELIDLGGVLVDGQVEHRRARRLTEGDCISVRFFLLPVAREVAGVPAGGVPFDVLYEDSDLLVVSKPAGVVTHPGAGTTSDTLVNGLLARYPSLAELPAKGFGSPERPGIVHRLDKETSGLLVVARSPQAFRSLSDQLANRSLSRRYRALVAGQLGPDQGLIDAPVGRSERDPTAMAVVFAGGRQARTRYKVLRRYRQPVDATELAIELETGRTHQIRVHFAAIGHPVLGDRRYGGARRSSGVTRLMLHAESIRFVHPTTEKEIELTAKLPAAFDESLGRFS